MARSMAMMWVLGLVLVLAPAGWTQSETLAPTPNRLIGAGEILSAGDFVDASIGRAPRDAILSVEALVGLQARRDLSPGRVVLRRAVGPPLIVQRNTPVTLVFHQGAVRVEAEGLALADAAAGEPVRVANAKTRRTITGVVTPDGRVRVQR